MGVDYRSRFGIGYKISEKVFEDDTYMDQYLDDLCKDKYTYFETGEGSYTGNSNEWYVVLKNPFEKTLDLSEQKDTLYNFLTDNNIEIIGDFGLQGGLHVY
jgi:hypothetical protein